MKGMADSLRDLGEPVSDRTLVLNLLRGLNGRYDNLKTWITRTVPFPSFSKVRNDLILEEITKGAAVPSDTAGSLWLRFRWAAPAQLRSWQAALAPTYSTAAGSPSSSR